jgi:subtilisin family serine protease
MADLHSFFENLVYRTVDHRRFTQQSPVMPDVWIRYGVYPGQQQDLLMVPNWHYTPAELARGLKQKRDADAGKKRPFRAGSTPASAAIAHNQNTVVARLYLDELVRNVLPLSSWWQRSIAGIYGRKDDDRLVEALEDEERLTRHFERAWLGQPHTGPLSSDVMWLAQVVGLLAYISTEEGRRELTRREGEDRKAEFLDGLLKEEPVKLAGALIDILAGVEPAFYGQPHPLYSVNRNRDSSPALRDSTASVKADASSRVFSVRGRGIRWAIIDSGIDAQHVAFRRRDASGAPRPAPFARRRSRRRRRGSYRFSNETRIVATYDFTHIRDLLGASPGDLDEISKKWLEWFPVLKNPDMQASLREYLEEYDDGVIDWERIEPFIRVEHTPSLYRPPRHRHGTHVAGILGADWRVSDAEHDLPAPRYDMAGVCPEIEMYDLRVLDDQGEGSEFSIMSAMQFVRALNNQRDFVNIHGVNLSLSIPHDVANYACGRTPVCEEAERLVGNGIVVVAAAGNSGRARYLTPSHGIDDGFRTVSITDPGNAESAITVGATHRRDAHTYGVSYFSSRGPTGDGRLKPDLVAPGEKILSTVPDNADDRLDGTSMAAPHVSGAAALIMERNFELIGQPAVIKKTLCETATDLNRERYFQGSGLLDILRALQAI